MILQGEQGNSFYLLRFGTAYAEKLIDGSIKKVMDYNPGDYFGELALLKDVPRAASIITKVRGKLPQSECECLTMDRHSFKRLLGPLDEILKRNTEIYDHYMSK